MISYGLGGLGGGALENAFAVRAYAFYENEVLLAPALIILAWVLYSIWNAINDPLAGYLSDRTWGFTRVAGEDESLGLRCALGPSLCFTCLLSRPRPHPPSFAVPLVSPHNLRVRHILSHMGS